MSDSSRHQLDALETAARAAYRDGFDVGATDTRLRAVLEETLEAPGNLTRLKLGLLASDALGLPEAAARSLATAFEYFHTASLILDDLPCMDDASMRRGRPCVHLRHGQAAAILGALAFINAAYALMWKALAHGAGAARDKAAAQAQRCLGDAGVLDGQGLDIHFRDSDGSPRAVARAALGKTVALLRLTLLTPALLAGARERELLLLDRLSVYWGLAYQIADDCADLSGLPTTGKSPGRDVLLGRPNFALAAGSVATVHRLGWLLSRTQRTLEELVALRKEWGALRPMVTHLAAATFARGTEVSQADRRCA